MTINKLLDRIHILTPAQIRDLSDKAMEMITNSYEESLIRELIYQGKSNASQRIIVARIMEAFDKYYNHLFLVDRPDFLDYIQLDLECGMVYTETGVKNENETEGAVKENKIPTTLQEKVHNIDNIKKENEELKAKIAALEEQLAEIEKKKKGISPGINQAQAALFGLSLANAFDFNYSNMKKDLAPVIHKLFGWGKSKIAYYLSTPCEKEEKEELANLFKDLCPHLYDVIMNKGRLPFGVTPKVTPHDEKVTPSKE